MTLVAAQIEASVTVLRRYGIGGSNLEEIIQAIADAIEANAPKPDQGLPGEQPHPDQGLPGEQPGVDNTLPGDLPGVDNSLPDSGAKPDQGLPGSPPGATQLPTEPAPDQGLPSPPEPTPTKRR